MGAGRVGRLGLLLSLLLGLLLSVSLSASAQTAHRSRARQDADDRRAQREARRLTSPYQDSHLLPGRRLRRGEGDQPAGTERLRFENDGRPRAVEPRRPGPARKRKDSTS